MLVKLGLLFSLFRLWLLLYLFINGIFYSIQNKNSKSSISPRTFSRLEPLSPVSASLFLSRHGHLYRQRSPESERDVREEMQRIKKREKEFIKRIEAL